MSARLIIKLVTIVLIVVFVLIQFVPYGRANENPPVTRELQWDSAVTYDLAKRACFDCHSNETVWPWYSNVAPVSWLVQRDVDEGRRKLNFSTWGQGDQEAEEIAEVIRDGEMPLGIYVLLHPSARLNTTEREQLIRGLSWSGGVPFEDDDGEYDD
jgi:hypothetical protein